MESGARKNGKLTTIANNVLIKNPTNCASSASAQVSRQLRQEYREQADRRQQRADLINERNAGMVGDLAQHGRAEAADAERKSEENAGNHSEPVRHQFLREHDDRRRRRRNNKADEHRQHRAGEQAGIGQRQREWQRTEDREPDHVFAAEPVAQRPAEECPECVGREKSEEIELGRLGRDAELIDQIEDVVTRQARDRKSVV